MLKSKSIYFLIGSIIMLIVIELCNMYGYFGYINFTMESYISDTNTKIFSLFDNISNFYIYFGVLALLLIFKGTRNYSKIGLLQFVLLLSTAYLLENFEQQYSNFFSLNFDLLTVYSFGLFLFMNIKKLTSSATIKVFSFIISFLIIFMVTICEFYFNQTDIFGLLFNIMYVAITTSLTYFLLYLRRYYFL